MAGYSDIGSSSNIVRQLAQDVKKHANFLVYFDNWFSSLGLFSELAEEGIFALGTIRPNRLPGCRISSGGNLKKKERGVLKKNNVALMKFLYVL